MTMVPVTINGLDFNYHVPDPRATMFVVEKVEGFYDTPDVDTHDEDLILSDGSLRGSTIIKSREIVVSGGVIGDPDSISNARDTLAALAASRGEMPLEIGNPYVGRTMISYVHSSAGLRCEFLNSNAIRYQLTFRASDPRLYAGGVESSTVAMFTGGTGRIYPRTYPWNYGAGPVPGAANVWNYGNIAAPVTLDYYGPLTETRLVTTYSDAFIRVAPLLDGERLTVYSDTLAAVVLPSYTSRASYVLSGSSPMLIPALSSPQWQVLGSGYGYVVLSWRSTWI